LLQVLDEGHITDGLGRKVDFKNTVLIMTSNVGAREIKKSGGYGFTTPGGDSDYEGMKSKILEEVKRVFNPEFLNRVDETIVFRQLLKQDMVKIIDLVIEDTLAKASERNLKIEMTKGAKEHIAEIGFDPVFGARPLKRTIQKHIEDPIAEELLKGTIRDGNTIKIKKKGNDLDFSKVEDIDEQKEDPPAKPEIIET
jgi:ATP-dependent Clp protease ATP-binding subunit ClpC